MHREPSQQTSEPWMAASGTLCSFASSGDKMLLAEESTENPFSRWQWVRFLSCHRLQQHLLLTGGPASPIPGTPLSPGCPGRPGAPLSPWNEGRSYSFCALLRKCAKMQEGFTKEHNTVTSWPDPARQGMGSSCVRTEIQNSFCNIMPRKVPPSLRGAPAHLREHSHHVSTYHIT